MEVLKAFKDNKYITATNSRQIGLAELADVLIDGTVVMTDVNGERDRLSAFSKLNGFIELYINNSVLVPFSEKLQVLIKELSDTVPMPEYTEVLNKYVDHPSDTDKTIFSSKIILGGTKYLTDINDLKFCYFVNEAPHFREAIYYDRDGVINSYEVGQSFYFDEGSGK